MQVGALTSCRLVCVKDKILKATALWHLDREIRRYSAFHRLFHRSCAENVSISCQKIVSAFRRVPAPRHFVACQFFIIRCMWIWIVKFVSSKIRLFRIATENQIQGQTKTNKKRYWQVTKRRGAASDRNILESFYLCHPLLWFFYEYIDDISAPLSMQWTWAVNFGSFRTPVRVHILSFQCWIYLLCNLRLEWPCWTYLTTLWGLMPPICLHEITCPVPRFVTLHSVVSNYDGVLISQGCFRSNF